MEELTDLLNQSDKVLYQDQSRRRKGVKSWNNLQQSAIATQLNHFRIILDKIASYEYHAYKREFLPRL